MKRAMFAAVLAAGAAFAVPALAAPSLSDAWYVKAGGKGADMLADRTACVTDAQQFGVDRATDFSNPEYGSLTALGAALDEDALHGGAKAAVRRAVRDACMQKKGWTRIDVSDADAKTLKKANSRNTGALDVWLVANTPKPKPAAPAVTPVSATSPSAAAVSAPGAAQPKTPDPAAPKP